MYAAKLTEELTVLETEESLAQVTEQIRSFGSDSCPLLPQLEPVQAETLSRDFALDSLRAANKYIQRRILVEGTVAGVYPGEEGTLFLTLSARPRGRCIVLICIPEHRRSAFAPVGQRAVCRGNCLFIREPYGVVLGDCELL